MLLKSTLKIKVFKAFMQLYFLVEHSLNAQNKDCAKAASRQQHNPVMRVCKTVKPKQSCSKFIASPSTLQITIQKSLLPRPNNFSNPISDSSVLNPSPSSF